MDLIDAVMAGDIAKVEELLNQGTDPNMYIDAAKVRPLHYAAQANNLEITKILVMAGADVYATTDPDGETPLDVARLHKSEAVINFLINHVKPSDTIN